MNNDSKEPLKGKELRDLARSEPGQAFIYLENNKDLWVQIAETDPFDSADTLEEFDPSEAGKLITSLPIETSVKIFESLRPRAIIEIVEILKERKVDFEFDGDMQPDVALNPEYEELYPFAKIVGKANILIMPGQHSAAISYKLMKTIGDTKVIGPLLIGLGLPIEIAPLRSSTSEILNLASIAAYSSQVIDYKK